MNPIIPLQPPPLRCADWWNEAKARYRHRDRSWIPCSNDFYMDMLEVVPPRYPEAKSRTFGWCFACGECWSHDAAGAEVYLCFRLKPQPACRMATMHELNTELSCASTHLPIQS